MFEKLQELIDTKNKIIEEVNKLNTKPITKLEEAPQAILNCKINIIDSLKDYLEGNRIETFYLPNEVKSIGENAFSDIAIDNIVGNSL
jgi:hypothetical protein